MVLKQARQAKQKENVKINQDHKQKGKTHDLFTFPKISTAEPTSREVHQASSICMF
jgi:hypothetical protein